MADIYTQFCDACYDKYVEDRMYNDPRMIRYYWCDIGERTPSIGRSRCGSCGDEGWKSMARVVGMDYPQGDDAGACVDYLDD